MYLITFLYVGIFSSFPIQFFSFWKTIKIDHKLAPKLLTLNYSLGCFQYKLFALEIQWKRTQKWSPLTSGAGLSHKLFCFENTIKNAQKYSPPTSWAGLLFTLFCNKNFLSLEEQLQVKIMKTLQPQLLELGYSLVCFSM